MQRTEPTASDYQGDATPGWALENCPPNTDDWTDEDEARAAGHPAAQAADFSQEPAE